MSLPRFHVQDLSASQVTLSEAEARHARQSRRLSAGDPVTLFDGRGRQATGRISDSDGRQIAVAVDNIAQIPRPRPALTLAFAIPKGPRQDLLIEKCTELGVSVLQPIHTARSVAGATTHRLDKWQRTAVEAAKQAGLAWLPDIRSPLNLEQLLREMPRCDLTLIALNSAVRPIHDLFPTLQAANTILTLVGPEGGWTDEEVTSVLTAGAAPISLGPNTLRIETAAIALAAAVHALLHT